MKKINGIAQFTKLDDNDTRWYSSIKQKISNLEQGYGTIEIVIKVKAKKVVALEHIIKGSENIG